MVAENYKTELKGSSCNEFRTFLNVSGQAQPDSSSGIRADIIDSYRRSRNMLPKILIGVLITVLLILNAFVLYFAYDKNIVVQQLRDEVNTLKRDVNLLKYRFIDDDLLDEIKAYENEAYSDTDNTYNDNEENDEDSTDGDGDGDDPDIDFDDVDFDYNSNYDDSPSSKETVILTDTIKQKKNLANSNRNKREILASTIDGVPIIAESYAEQKKKNRTFSNGETLKLYGTLAKDLGDTAKTFDQKKHGFRTTHTGGWVARTYTHRHHNPQGHLGDGTKILSRSSRVMHTDEDKSKAFRKVVKKSLLRSAESTSERIYQEHVAGPDSVATRDGSGVVSIHRRRKHGGIANLESMDEKHQRNRRMLPVAHFNGDASKYVYGQHQHYKGNGRLAHPQGLYVDWAPTSWVKSLGMDRIFHMHDGVLTVRDSGLYFIYAQIYYLDEHDTNGYRVFRNDSLVAQCTTMTHSTTNVVKGNTCYTATVEYLIEGDKITLKDIANMRYSLFENGKSFFGLIKISDAKIK